jgi:hypothetical protein
MVEGLQMTTNDKVLVPQVGEHWQHKNGGVYTVLHVTNTAVVREGHTPDVVYQGRNGNVWSRPLSDWHRSFTLAAAPQPAEDERITATHWKAQCEALQLALDVAERNRRRSTQVVVSAERQALEWPLSILRAGHWKEVYIGHRCMRLEVTYQYDEWQRLMADVEAALSREEG